MGGFEISPQAIFIIVFLVIGAIRWVLENAVKGKQQPPEMQDYDYDERADTAPPRRSTLEDLYEEARREIQDRQNRNYPEPETLREQLQEYQAPVPPPLPPQVQPAPRAEPIVLKEVKKPTLSAEEQAALKRFQEGTKTQSRARHQSRVRELLSSPSSARDAIVLAEILGPPKGTERERYARPTA